MTTIISSALRTSIADRVTALVDAGVAAGTLKIYTGAQPAGPGTAPTGTLLVTFTLTDPAFAAAVAGVADLDADPDLSAIAGNTGTAGWFRIADSDGNGVLDGAVATSGSQLNLSSTSITSGGTVTITAGTVTAPAS